MVAGMSHTRVTVTHEHSAPLPLHPTDMEAILAVVRQVARNAKTQHEISIDTRDDRLVTSVVLGEHAAGDPLFKLAEGCKRALEILNEVEEKLGREDPVRLRVRDARVALQNARPEIIA